MKEAGDSKTSKSQSSRPYESLSDPRSDVKSSKYRKALRAAENNFDFAATHKSNEELRECEAFKSFFAQAAKVESLKGVGLEAG